MALAEWEEEDLDDLEADVVEVEGISGPAELLPYGDFGTDHDDVTGTRQVTKEEADLMIQHDQLHSFSNGFVDSFDHIRSDDLLWHTVVTSASEPTDSRIRAVLDDGTPVPAIRAPSLLDKARLYIPDRAETRANLNEASRRTLDRRASRYYFVEGSDEEVEKIGELSP